MLRRKWTDGLADLQLRIPHSELRLGLPVAPAVLHYGRAGETFKPGRLSGRTAGIFENDGLL